MKTPKKCCFKKTISFVMFLCVCVYVCELKGIYCQLLLIAYVTGFTLFFFFWFSYGFTSMQNFCAKKNKNQERIKIFGNIAVNKYFLKFENTFFLLFLRTYVRTYVCKYIYTYTHA